MYHMLYFNWQEILGFEKSQIFQEPQQFTNWQLHVTIKIYITYR